MTELEVIKMLAAYSKELAETDGLGEKGLVQINWAKRLIQALHKPVVMQAEGSDGAKGAAVGNSAAGQSGSADSCNHVWRLLNDTGVMKCMKCGKMK